MRELKIDRESQRGAEELLKKQALIKLIVWLLPIRFLPRKASHFLLSPRCLL